jgi:hypothetical protein
MIDPRKIRAFDPRGMPSTENSVLAHRLVDRPPARPSRWADVLAAILAILVLLGLVVAAWYVQGVGTTIIAILLLCIFAAVADNKKGK